MSAGLNSIDAVKRRIKDLQDQADDANERADQLQKDLEKERKTREEVKLAATHLYRFFGRSCSSRKKEVVLVVGLLALHRW